MKTKETEKVNDSLMPAERPVGVQELMKTYERFQESYAVILKYLELVSPETRQSNSDRSVR